MSNLILGFYVYPVNLLLSNFNSKAFYYAGKIKILNSNHLKHKVVKGL